jgi:hypothetical protein
MPTGRKILFFLGAGASYAAGAATRVQAGGRVPIPTQATFWDTFLRFCSSEERRDQIESFLFRYFKGYGRLPARSSPASRRRQLNGIDVEEVFTYLSERFRAPSTTPQLRSYAAEIWEALVMEIGTVFSRFQENQQTRTAYREFLKRHVRSHDAVVSFNWDTVFENSLPRTRRWAYESVQDSTDCLRVLKPHGSVNWESSDNGIRIIQSPSQPVIVAPTHLKFVSSKTAETRPGELVGYLDQVPAIQDIWASMERQMRQAKVLIFIGYSFPVSDLYFSSILRSVLASRQSPPVLVVVNPDAVTLAERLRNRFAVSDIVRYFDFQQFLQVSREGVLRQVT